MRFAGYRVLEHRVWEVGGRRLLATGSKRHGPVDREASVVVLRGDGHELERRVRGVVGLPEAPEDVAVGGRQCRDRAPALLELGQSADEGRAEVRDDDVDLWILGD